MSEAARKPRQYSDPFRFGLIMESLLCAAAIRIANVADGSASVVGLATLNFSDRCKADAVAQGRSLRRARDEATGQ
ncbi:MAG: hypothetical protein M3Z29_14060 [Pseudomonadota bacterium]|nr:hypothetical protein [Pseudomonadota bacterium]